MDTLQEDAAVLNPTPSAPPPNHSGVLTCHDCTLAEAPGGGGGRPLPPPPPPPPAYPPFLAAASLTAPTPSTARHASHVSPCVTSMASTPLNAAL